MSQPVFHWFDRGNRLPRIGPDVFGSMLDLPFRHFCLVLVRSQANITTVRWDPAYADQASIDAAADKVLAAAAPATLVFYKEGWFKEHYRTAAQAVDRMFEVQGLGNVELAHAAYLRRERFDMGRLPPLIRLMMQRPEIYASCAVETFLDERENWFAPTYAGNNSATSQVLGPDWIEHGTIERTTRNAPTDHALTQEYQSVLDTWKPRYDQVLAALARDDGEPVWVPYHRVVVPRKSPCGGYGTSNLIALGNVDLAPLGTTRCVW